MMMKTYSFCKSKKKVNIANPIKKDEQRDQEHVRR